MRQKGAGTSSQEAWCVSMLSQSLSAPGTSLGPKTTGPRAQLSLLRPPGPTRSSPTPFMGQSSRGQQSCHLDQRSPLLREPRRAERHPAGLWPHGQKHKLASVATEASWLPVLQPPRGGGCGTRLESASGVLCVTVIAVTPRAAFKKELIRFLSLL